MILAILDETVLNKDKEFPITISTFDIRYAKDDSKYEKHLLEKTGIAFTHNQFQDLKKDILWYCLYPVSGIQSIYINFMETLVWYRENNVKKSSFYVSWLKNEEIDYLTELYLQAFIEHHQTIFQEIRSKSIVFSQEKEPEKILLYSNPDRAVKEFLKQHSWSLYWTNKNIYKKYGNDLFLIRLGVNSND